MKYFIFHGTYGSPEENWYPWLKQKLGAVVPRFPTPKNQSLENWLKVFDGSQLDTNSIIIAHSFAPAFALTLLENHSAKACFFVSGWLGLLNNPDFDPLIKTFTTREFDWQSIKSNCDSFTLFHSDNDPYVPLEKARELAQKLGTEVIVVPGAGHFNEEAGFKEFPLLLEKISATVING